MNYRSNIQREFLQRLACPMCKSDLQQKKELLICKRLHEFPVREGIPIFYEVRNNPQHEQQEQYFEKFYKQYERLPRLNWHESYWRLLTSNIPIQPRKTFVDIATGTGWMAVRAAEAGCVVIATELTYEIARQAQAFARKEGLEHEILFIVSDAERMPLKKGVVDYITAIALLEHLPDDKKAIQEMGRVVRRDGYVWIVTPNDLKTQPVLFKLILFFYDKVLGHVRHYGQKQLAQKFTRAGFAPVREFYVGHMIKFVQLFIHAIFRNNRLWWYFDRIDQRQITKPNSINLVMGFKKK